MTKTRDPRPWMIGKEMKRGPGSTNRILRGPVARGIIKEQLDDLFEFDVRVSNRSDPWAADE